MKVDLIKNTGIQFVSIPVNLEDSSINSLTLSFFDKKVDQTADDDVYDLLQPYYWRDDKSFIEVIKGSIYNLSSAIISIILGFVINLIIARYYGASILGTFSLVSSILSIVIIFTLMGTNTALLRLIPEHITKYSHISAYNIFIKVLKIVVILSIILSIIIYIISPLISIYIIKNDDLSSLLRISSIFIIFNSLFIVLLATLRALGSIKLYAVLQVLLPISI